MTVSLAQMIEEVELELSYRERVYPHLISSRKKRKSEAEWQMIRMKAVLALLRGLQAKEKAV